MREDPVGLKRGASRDSEPSNDGRANTGSMTGRDPDPRSGPVAAVRWFLNTESPPVVMIREAAASILVVAVIGLILLLVSGVWPPLVAVESGSMEPHLSRGDLVFIMDEQRLVPPSANEETGIVTYRLGQESGYRSMGAYGNVIVFNPPDRTGPPIIHRARFWVEAGERWVSEANPAFLRDDDCAAVPSCPAPHDGFVTKGDANPYYDQAQGIATIVKPSWIRGTAEFAIPWVGHVRLSLGEVHSAFRTRSTATVRLPPRTLPVVM